MQLQYQKMNQIASNQLKQGTADRIDPMQMIQMIGQEALSKQNQEMTQHLTPTQKLR